MCTYFIFSVKSHLWIFSFWLSCGCNRLQNISVIKRAYTWQDLSFSWAEYVNSLCLFKLINEISIINKLIYVLLELIKSKGSISINISIHKLLLPPSSFSMRHSVFLYNFSTYIISISNVNLTNLGSTSFSCTYVTQNNNKPSFQHVYIYLYMCMLCFNMHEYVRL